MKKFVSLLTALVLVLSLTACGGKSDTPAASTGEEDASPFAGKTVSVMTPYMASVTTNQMVGYPEADLTAQGAEVNVIDTANDFAELASRIEDVTASGTDAIVLVSADPTQLENQLREAMDAGIPVFGVDSGYIDGMQVNATSDNHQTGQLIAGYLFDDLMGGEGTNLKATVAQNFQGMVDIVVEDLGKLFAGETIETGEKYAEATLITADNAADFIK